MKHTKLNRSKDFTLTTGAQIFSTGTIQYSWGLDDYSPIEYLNINGVIIQRRVHEAMTNSNAQILAENVLHYLGGN